MPPAACWSWSSPRAAPPIFCTRTPRSTPGTAAPTLSSCADHDSEDVDTLLTNQHLGSHGEAGLNARNSRAQQTLGAIAETGRVLAPLMIRRSFDDAAQVDVAIGGSIHGGRLPRCGRPRSSAVHLVQ